MFVSVVSTILSTILGQPATLPQRIIVVGPNVAEVICALGACGQIVGVDKFCKFPPELANRPRIGGLFDPDLEKIIALNPDWVVLRGRNVALEQLCVRRKIPLHLDRTERLADIESGILEIAKQLNRPNEGIRMAAEFHRRIDDLRRRTAAQSHPRVLLTVSRRPDGIANVLTTGKGTFLDEMLQIAGGTNVFGQLDMAWPQVSPEAILTQQPEIIIELMPDLVLTPQLTLQLSQAWTKLGSLPAVSEGRIHILTDDNALIPSPRYIEFMERLSALIHPHAP